MSFCRLFLVLASALVAIGQTADTAPPVLRSLSFNPMTIDTSTGPASVTVGFTVTDDISGVTSVSVGFMSPSGQQMVFATPTLPNQPQPLLSVTTSAIATFPKSGETGTWTVCHVVLYDAFGYSSYLTY